MKFDRVVLVAGTRPEFVKLHPVAVALSAAGVNTLLVTTEQHSSPVMKDAFLEKLEWTCKITSLRISASDALGLLAEIARTLPAQLTRGDLVMVEGDTTSVLAAAIVANKLGFPLAHIEAGLRSYDLRMPEEHNRRVCDHLADELFAPTDLDARHLLEERVPGRVHVVGNTVIDAVRQNMSRIAAVPSLGEGYVLITLHRQENVDHASFLAELVRFLESVDTPCVFPVHPRTRDKLTAAGLWDRVRSLRHVRILEPLDYLTFLAAMRDAAVVLTDSGGVQEEATAPEIHRPVIVVRRSTERVPAIDAGFSILAPADAGRLTELVHDRSWFRASGASPFGDGHAAEAIVRCLTDAPGI
jgi:UDP-N-acetylglucosamine 2-epimerase (non-hydrolysing)